MKYVYDFFRARIGILLVLFQPLFDNDAGSPATLATYIGQMKSKFVSAGLDMPVSISDMAYGWQNAGDISSMVSAVDFFMINDFPYFSNDATTGGSAVAWNDFFKDLQYFASIANGKHLMVTQVRKTKQCTTHIDANDFPSFLFSVTDWLAINP